MKLCFKFITSKLQCLLIIPATVKRSPFFQIVAFFDFQLRHQLAEICLCVFGVDIKRFFAVFVRTAPVAVLKEYKRALYKGICRRVAGGNGRGGLSFWSSRLRLVLDNDLLDTPHNVIDKADLAHVLRLQVGKLLRKLVGVHVLVAGNEQL